MTKRFSWHSKSGGYAEDYLIKKIFPSLGLEFDKIQENNEEKNPDGWILRNKQKIALTEIKLIKYHSKSNTAHSGVVRITIDRPIQDAISRAKKQFKSIKTNLPKILYLILDDPFAKSKSILAAAFGPWITIERAGKTVYNGPRGFHPIKKLKQDNKILGNWLSAIICYIPDTEGYKLLIFTPQNMIDKIPKELMPTEAIQEKWEYSDKSIVKKK